MKPYNDKQDMMLAPDSEYFQHQLAHNSLTHVQQTKNSISINFSETDKLPGIIGKGELTLKIKSDKPIPFTSDNIIIISNSLINESEFLYTLKLKRLKEKTNAKILIS
jgi:hypothetical protein